MVLDDDEEEGERRRQPTPRLITALAHQDKSTAARGQQVESSTAGMLCAGCSVEGRALMIVSNDPRPVLRPAFGWGNAPRTATLCALVPDGQSAEDAQAEAIDDEQYSCEFDTITARWIGRLELALQGLGAEGER